MKKADIIYQADEIISGYSSQLREWIRYSAVIKIQDSGKYPVTLEMSFIPPHPYLVNMPTTHFVKAETISKAFGKVNKFLNKYSFEIRF